MEYMVIATILLVAMIVVSIMSFQSVREFSRIRLDTETESVLNNIGGTIDLAVMEGDGFRTNVTLPQTILDYDYEIGVASNIVFINVKNITYTRYMLSSNITGSLAKGVNLVENRNGEIVITQW